MPNGETIKRLKKSIEERCADRIIEERDHPTKKEKIEKHSFTSSLKEKHNL